MSPASVEGMDVNGKAAFITGGGTGVGRATALALAAQGCDVAVNYSRSKDAAEQTAAEVTALGVKGIALQGDVAEDTDCRRMVDQAVEAFSRLDVLVNSAGTTVFVPHHDLDGITADDWHNLYAVNTMGPFQMMRAAMPHLKADGGGEVISISSVAQQNIRRKRGLVLWRLSYPKLESSDCRCVLLVLAFSISPVSADAGTTDVTLNTYN